MSMPVAGFWATCPLRNSSPAPRTPTEKGPTGAASLSVAIASRVIVKYASHIELGRNDRPRSCVRSVGHTPRDRETGRHRAAQFSTWLVYIERVHYLLPRDRQRARPPPAR